MEHSSLYFTVQNTLVQFPLLVTLIVCSILAVARWKRHPKVSLSVLISMVLLFLHSLTFALVFAVGTDWLARMFGFRPEKSIIVLSFIYNSTLAIIVAILLMGVFIQRRELSSSARPGASL